MDNFYAGVGSRETPGHILVEMVSIARKLRERGWTLRSGGAPGADIAFGAGAGKDMRAYLPWPGFNGHDGISVGHLPAFQTEAARHHPAWHRLKPGAKMLHARNVAQVLGYSPENQYSKFVVCWTPGGLGGGGTGQAIRIAKAYNIPVYDLADENGRAGLEMEYLRDEEEPD